MPRCKHVSTFDREQCVRTPYVNTLTQLSETNERARHSFLGNVQNWSRPEPGGWEKRHSPPARPPSVERQLTQVHAKGQTSRQTFLLVANERKGAGGPRTACSETTYCTSECRIVPTPNVFVSSKTVPGSFGELTHLAASLVPRTLMICGPPGGQPTNPAKHEKEGPTDGRAQRGGRARCKTAGRKSPGLARCSNDQRWCLSAFSAPACVVSTGLGMAPGIGNRR